MSPIIPSPPDAASATALVTMAQAAGSHAFGAFLLMLCLLIVGSAWVGARASRANPLTVASPTPVAIYGRCCALAVAAVAAFSGLASGMVAGGEFVHVDAAFSTAVRDGISPRATRFFAAFTRLGDSLALTVLCVAVARFLIARRERLLALGLCIAVGGNGVLNGVLKRALERARPPHDAAVSALFHGWSFPSGHASGSLVAAGMIAYLVARPLTRSGQLSAVLLAIAVAFAIGASRVFIGVHYASDVLGGFASGAAWLALCILVLEWARHRAPTKPERPGSLPPGAA